MKVKTHASLVGAAIALMLVGCQQTESASTQPVGASLNEKFDLKLSEVPQQALAEVLKLQPDFQLAEADKELKHGHTYIDLEGTKSDGSEVEFDLLLQEGQWRVMEVQRDLSLAQCPANVVQALKKGAPSFEPKRIIESDQRTGVIVYEFFTVHGDGTEELKEVKLENGQAELLTKAWQH